MTAQAIVERKSDDWRDPPSLQKAGRRFLRTDASFQSSTLHQTRDGLFQQIENPEPHSPEFRWALILLIKQRMGISEN